MARTFILLSLLLVAACGAEATSTADTAHVNGTVASKDLTPRSAVARYGDLPSAVHGLTVVVSDRDDTCAAMHAQGATSVMLSIPGAQIAPGSYGVVVKSPGSGESAAVFTAADQMCKSTVLENATGGTVTVKDVLSDLGTGGSRIRGSFTLVFSDGDVTGDFDAVLCGSSGDAGASNVACTP